MNRLALMSTNYSITYYYTYYYILLKIIHSLQQNRLEKRSLYNHRTLVEKTLKCLIIPNIGLNKWFPIIFFPR